MPCEEFENPISDYLENQLSPADRAKIAAHLAGCNDCRAFARQLKQLDMALLRTVKAPVLPTAFKSKLQRRIQTTVVLSESDRAERKRQLQAEYEAVMARLNHFPLPPRKLLAGLGYCGLIALTAWLAWLLIPRLTNLLAGTALGEVNQSLLLSLATSAIFVVIGLAAAFPTQVKRLMALV